MQEESSTTWMDLELERKLEEGMRKRRFEQGEPRNTPNMVKDKVSWILATITTTTSEIQAKVNQH